MSDSRLLYERQQNLTRRHFTQWLASASALLWTLPSFAESASNNIMFFRPGDPYSDPKKLRKRYDRGGTEMDVSTQAGMALQWRILQDPFVAGAALGKLLASESYNSRRWFEVAQYVIATNWLSDYPRFTPALKVRTGDALLAMVEREIPKGGLDDPAVCSFSSGTVEFLTLCLFAFLGGSRLSPANPSLAALRLKLDGCLRTMMAQMQFTVPDGSTHESMDIMRNSYAPLVMLTEARRTLSREDIAEQISLFANLGSTYLYKMLPDGTFSRKDDIESCVFNQMDPMVLGYAVHRFQDRYAAWLLRNTPDMPSWRIPAMQFLWDDPSVAEVNPANAAPRDLRPAKHFRGVDQVVFRSGFGEKDTRIEFDCGPYFARHQHLDRNHFAIHHRGHLAVDSGAGYSGTESPHYLNYYRRSVAHNTMLVFDPAERFFWKNEGVAAANDGGQRMDSWRYWNTLTSVSDWQEGRDKWDIGRLRNVETGDPRYMYALGDATKAYSAEKMTKFTRELLFFPAHDVLFVYDSVVSTRPELRKTWLLHTVNEPEFVLDEPAPVAPPGPPALKPAVAKDKASTVRTTRVAERDGEMLVHTFLPERCDVTTRGGPGQEFWTPGDSTGGAWGSGRNWPLDPADGGPLPTNAEELALWRAFYGDRLTKLEKSNRDHAVPGAWRLEVTPGEPATEDIFFHAFEIGDRGKTGHTPAVRIHGAGFEGALCGRMVALFIKAEHGQKALKFTLPNEAVDAIWMRGLPAGLEIAVDFFDGTVPLAKLGMPLFSNTTRTTPRGTVMITGQIPAGARVSLRAGQV